MYIEKLVRTARNFWKKINKWKSVLSDIKMYKSTVMKKSLVLVEK